MASILDALGGLASVPASGLGMIREGLAVFGGRSGFAAAIAGTSDKRSAEYKAALKSVERWDRYEAGERGKDVRNPDRMRGETRRKLASAIRRGKIPPRARFDVQGTITVSKDTRRRSFNVTLSRDEILGMIGQAQQAEALGKSEGESAQAAMNVITGAYLGSDARYEQQELPYSERMIYALDTDVTITRE